MRTKGLLPLFLISVMAPGSMLWGTHDDSHGFQTTEELQTAVDLWVSDNATALSTYGEINTWDVSLITDMSELFKSKTTFNDNISGWQVAIEAQSGDYFDRYNRFGCLESASNGLDWHDNPEMAPMGNHISMYFSSMIENSVVPMTSDLRQTLDHVQVWDGEISGSGLTDPVEISWNVEKEPPGDIAVNMIDMNTRRVLDLSAPDRYLLGDLDDRYSRQVTIVAGDPEQVALAVDEILATIPQELSLDGNYPNPFNPVTTIRYGLPQPREVRVTVVNILGQEITELLNGWRDMGRHEVVWQGLDRTGKPVASGMYFTVLSDGNKMIVQKMLLLK